MKSAVVELIDFVSDRCGEDDKMVVAARAERFREQEEIVPCDGSLTFDGKDIVMLLPGKNQVKFRFHTACDTGFNGMTFILRPVPKPKQVHPLQHPMRSAPLMCPGCGYWLTKETLTHPVGHHSECPYRTKTVWLEAVPIPNLEA